MIKVLIVEDGDTAASFYGQVVKGLPGFEVGDVLESLEEVRNTWGQSPYPFDCAIVDMQIYQKIKSARGPDDRPHTDWGVEALSVIKDEVPKNRIVVVTAYPRDVRGALTAIGLEDRLHDKPIHPKKLASLLTDMFRQVVA